MNNANATKLAYTNTAYTPVGTQNTQQMLDESLKKSLEQAAMAEEAKKVSLAIALGQQNNNAIGRPIAALIDSFGAKNPLTPAIPIEAMDTQKVIGAANIAGADYTKAPLELAKLEQEKQKTEILKSMKESAAADKEDEKATNDLAKLATEFNKQRGVIGQNTLLINRGRRIEATYGKNPTVASLDKIVPELLPDLALGIASMSGAGNPGIEVMDTILPKSMPERVQKIKSWLSGEALPAEIGEKIMPLVNLQLREMAVMGHTAKGQMKAMVSAYPRAAKAHPDAVLNIVEGLTNQKIDNPDEIGLYGVTPSTPIAESPGVNTPQYNTGDPTSSPTTAAPITDPRIADIIKRSQGK